MSLAGCVTAATSVAAAIVLWQTLAAMSAMSRATCHLLRAAMLAVSVGALGLAMSPFYGEIEFKSSALILVAGVAAFLVRDRRHASRTEEPGNASAQGGFLRLSMSGWLLAAALLAVLLSTYEARGANPPPAASAEPMAQELKTLAWMRENCKQNCVLMPLPQWQQLAAMLRDLRATVGALAEEQERAQRLAGKDCS